jgi:hypothetical protein
MNPALTVYAPRVPLRVTRPILDFHVVHENLELPISPVSWCATTTTNAPPKRLSMTVQFWVFYRFPPFSHFYTGISEMTGMAEIMSSSRFGSVVLAPFVIGIRILSELSTVSCENYA